MRLQKLAVFNKLLDQGVKPHSPEFEKCVASLLKEKINEEADLKYVSEETLGKVAQVAQKFKSDMKMMFTSPKVSTNIWITITLGQKTREIK